MAYFIMFFFFLFVAVLLVSFLSQHDKYLPSSDRSRLGRKKTKALQRLATYTNMEIKGADIEGVYRGVHLNVSTYGKGGAGTEIRLRLHDASSNPHLKKHDKREIERLLKRFPSAFASYDRSLVFRGEKVLYREQLARTNTYKIRVLMNYLCDLVNAYPHIIQLGGEAVPLLRPLAQKDEHPLHNMATRLLMEIGHFTTSAFESRSTQVYCKQCLVHFASHEVGLGGISSTQYYGCRRCLQSRSYYEGIKLIFVLDNKMRDKWTLKNKALYVNGYKQQKIFDFDEVVIKHASDKAVASFAIKVGNDTDAHRTKRYKDIPCTVMDTSTVSANTISMLERVFGQVQRMETHEHQPG